MELLEFLLLCACTQSFGSDIPSSSQPIHSEDLISDTPLSSIFLVLCAVLYTASCLPQMGRECWKVPRNSTAWEGVQNQALMDAQTRDTEWRKTYRMGFASLTYMTEEIRPYIENPNTDFVREPVDIKKAVAMVIHRLAHGESPRKIGDLYNLGASTVIKYTKIITGVLANRKKLYSKYIVIPTEERIRRLSSKFECSIGIPNVSGAIGGTHIKLQLKPRNSYRPADYWCSHGFYSVLLQGVCDADKVFWDVCCNAPGGLDNSTHLRASSIWGRLKDGEILQKPEIHTSNGVCRPVIIGNRSYPLMPFLIIPFNVGSNEAIRENQFDEDLLRGQAKIGNAFAVLKNRWKILEKLNVDVKYAAQTVLACCVLHNFCQIAGEPEPDEQIDNSPNQDFVIPYEDEEEAILQTEGREETRRILFNEWLRKGEEAGLERAARRQRLF